ncbi:hypothetical protein LCGC14_0412360 [marine sediment metagenome]|uniref:Uncharacterized protein n=1 Tax=marine sediment metagenome TaxID=412755 RepID=A0A0F9STL6_9ZZZZ
MGSLAVPHSFKRDAPASGTDVNENFDEVEAQVNDIDDDNIADEGIGEAKTLFDTSGGHDHDGVNSKLMTAIAGDRIDLAASNGTRGTIRFKTGSDTISFNGTDTITFTGVAFDEIPLIVLYMEGGTDHADFRSKGTNYLRNVTAASFDVVEGGSGILGWGDRDYRWVAIGI